MQSLNDLSIDLKTNENVSMTKQSLNARFNEQGVTFLKSFIAEFIKRQIGNNQILFRKLGNFKKLLIKDSTSFQIHESMATMFPGSGGAGSKAAVRIQFEYDLLSGQVTDLSIGPFNKQDLTDAKETVDKVEEGALILRDMGYISVDVLQSINNRAAFYLGRLHSETTVYMQEGQEIVKVDFKKIQRKMKKQGIKQMEIQVYISEQKLPVRMIIYTLPDEVIEPRQRKARRNAQKKGRQISKQYLIRSRFNLFITNLSPEQLSVENAWQLYRMRWQIELVFKVWKSVCRIAHVKKVNVYRLQAYIYATLLFILVAWHIYWGINLHMENKHKKTLSFMKVFKTIQQQSSKLKDAVREGAIKISAFLKELSDISVKYHLLEIKKRDCKNPLYALNIIAL